MILANEHNDEMMREIGLFKDIRHKTLAHIMINTICLMYSDYILYCHKDGIKLPPPVFLKAPDKVWQ